MYFSIFKRGGTYSIEECYPGLVDENFGQVREIIGGYAVEIETYNTSVGLALEKGIIKIDNYIELKEQDIDLLDAYNELKTYLSKDTDDIEDAMVKYLEKRKYCVLTDAESRGF